MERRAAKLLEQSRADGESPLFSEQQAMQLADMCAAKGHNTALYLEAYTAMLRKLLPEEATGEELVAWMEESVKNPPPTGRLWSTTRDWETGLVVPRSKLVYVIRRMFF